MNYTELVAAIEAYAENYDTGTGGFVENIPVFVKQAEQRIYNTVQLPSLRKNVTGITSPANKYLSCPNDYLATYSIAVIENYGLATETYTYLINKDVNFIREAYPLSAYAAEPKHYAIFGPNSSDVNELTFIVGPTPNLAYMAELHYYYYPESIVTAGTTWLGDNFDSTLLYGTICEAFVYMRQEADMMKIAQDRYVQAIALLKNLGDGKQRADAYRDGQVRVQVS
jgi:hypothetical protein